MESEHEPPFPHILDRPGELRRQDRQGLALARFVLEAGQGLVARRMGAEPQDRRCGTGPRALGVAALRAGGARPLPGRFLGACDHAARGHASLDPWDAGEVMHRRPKHETQARAEARDGLEHGQGGGILRLGRLPHGQCQVPPQLVLLVEEGEVHLDAFLDGGIGQPLRAPRPRGLVRALVADLGQVVLAGSVRDMRPQLSAFPHARYPAPKQVAGRPHGRGRARGLGPHSATQQDRNVLSSHFVVLGFAPMHRLHREGMPKDNRPLFAGAQVSAPVPGEDACDGHDDLLPIRSKGLEHGSGAGGPIAMHHDLAVMVQNPDVHGAGMQVDAAVKWVLGGGESPEVSSSCA